MAVKNGTRFYLTEDGYASDIRSRAQVYRWEDQAEAVAAAACSEQGWQGFCWTPIRTAEDLATA